MDPPPNRAVMAAAYLVRTGKVTGSGKTAVRDVARALARGPVKKMY
jgi:hypothetical protein